MTLEFDAVRVVLGHWLSSSENPAYRPTLKFDPVRPGGAVQIVIQSFHAE